MGTPQDLLDLLQLVLDDVETEIRGEVRGEVKGRVVVEKGAVVEGVVHGPAYIGREVYVGKNAEIEHYTSLEEKSAAAEGSISRSLILEESKVSISRGRLTDSVVGPRTQLKLAGGRYKIVVGEGSKIEEV